MAGIADHAVLTHRKDTVLFMHLYENALHGKFFDELQAAEVVSLVDCGAYIALQIELNELGKITNKLLSRQEQIKNSPGLPIYGQRGPIPQALRRTADWLD